jgi:hypothetical protein
MSEELDLMLAERAIQRVLTSYSRGVDRFDFGLVQSCYWPTAPMTTAPSPAGSMSSSPLCRSHLTASSGPPTSSATC